jgi:hypothetical protein
MVSKAVQGSPVKGFGLLVESLQGFLILFIIPKPIMILQILS